MIRISKKHLNLKLILVATVLFLSIIAVSKNTNTQVEAQIAGFGDSCIDHVADCTEIGAGYTNLNKGISNGSVSLQNLSSSRFQESVTKNLDSLSSGTRKANYSEVCIDKTLNAIVPHVVIRNTPNSGPDLPAYNEQQFYYVTARACSGSDVPTQMASTIPQSSHIGYPDISEYWKCCPANSVFVPGSKSAGVIGSLKDLDPPTGACCTLPSASSKPGDSDYPAVVNNGSCSNRDLQAIPTSTLSNEYKSGDSDIPLGLSDSVGSGWLATDTTSGLAKSVCGVSKGCAIIDKTNTPGVVQTEISSGGNKYQITTVNNLTTKGVGTNLMCQKCFSDGDAMFIEDTSSNPSGKQQLVICNSSDPTFIKRQDLIDNSVSATLAYIQAQGQENKDLIKSCTEAGGVPWALGCVDPTPLGIITGLIRIALGTVGGVALVQFILIGVSLMRGDDAKIKENRERLLATLAGVAVLVFSVLILRILGVNVLDILPAGSV